MDAVASGLMVESHFSSRDEKKNDENHNGRHEIMMILFISFFVGLPSRDGNKIPFFSFFLACQTYLGPIYLVGVK